MGIAIPRPIMGSAEIRTVTNRLALHAKLMAQYEAEGMTRAEASKKAFTETTRAIRYRKQ